MAMSGIEGDRYRSYLHGEGKQSTKWRHGAPPNYDVVNKLFEDERTKVWPPRSLEEKVHSLVKTWEMELFHKSSLDDFKSIDTKEKKMSETFKHEGHKEAWRRL
ncbi:hypothetical protein CRYUN_Cryun35bG0077100 [Craigia yunnanensis]